VILQKGHDVEMPALDWDGHSKKGDREATDPDGQEGHKKPHRRYR